LNNNTNAKNGRTIFPKDLFDYSVEEQSINTIRELLIYKNKLIYPQYDTTLDYYLSLSESFPQKFYFDENLRYRPIDVSSNFQSDQNVWNLSLPYNIGWSSMGRKQEDSVEWLVFKTTDPITIISSIKIVHKDYDIPGSCYGAKRVKIEIGFSEDNYHYESNVVNLAPNFEDQYINIPHIVLGSYVRITLYGKLVRWTLETTNLVEVPTDDKYYLAILSIDIYGNNLAKFPWLKATLADYLNYHNIHDHNIKYQLYGSSYFSAENSQSFIEFIEENFIENLVTRKKFQEFSSLLDNNVLYLLNYPHLKRLVIGISKKNEEFVMYYLLHYIENPSLYYKYIHDLKALFCAYNNVYLFYEGIERLIGLVIYYPDRTSKIISDMGRDLKNSCIMLGFEDYWNNHGYEKAFFALASFEEIIKSLNRKVVYKKDIVELVKNNVTNNLSFFGSYRGASLITRLLENND
jgi:hypothetical protein